MKRIIDTILSWDYFTRASLLALSNAAFYLSQIHLQADPLRLVFLLLALAAFLLSAWRILLTYGRWHFCGVLLASLCLLHGAFLVPLVVCAAAFALGFILEMMADDFRPEPRVASPRQAGLK